MDQATLVRELNTYSEPDTGLPPTGRISEGSYPLAGSLSNHPDRDTDYMQLVTDVSTDERGWVCSRWKDRIYAVAEAETGLDLVPESALVTLLPEFRGYQYHLHQPRYPFSLPGLPDSLLEPPAVNNCCTFVEALLVKAWHDTHGSAFEWGRQRHAQMMITDIADPFSPITAITESGMGAAVADPDALPKPWTAVQAWKRGPGDGGWGGGHTFLVLDTHPATRRILTLESNDFYGMDGPGFRAVGDLDDFAAQNPGPRWHEEGGVWTWENFRQVYPHMKLAKLAVTHVGWISAADRPRHPVG